MLAGFIERMEQRAENFCLNTLYGKYQMQDKIIHWLVNWLDCYRAQGPTLVKGSTVVSKQSSCHPGGEYFYLTTPLK